VGWLETKKGAGVAKKRHLRSLFLYPRSLDRTFFAFGALLPRAPLSDSHPILSGGLDHRGLARRRIELAQDAYLGGN